MEETDSKPWPGGGGPVPEVLPPPGRPALLLRSASTHLLRPH